MSFSKTKDRSWVAYNLVASWLARQPTPVRRVGYGFFGLVLWVAYLLPGNMVRPTFVALSKHVDAQNTTRLFANFARGFCRGMNRMEQVRHGRTVAIDAMLRIPEDGRLKELLGKRGAVLVIPHTHASLAMGRGLARRYPLLALVRSGGDERRASSEMEIYRNLGCEFVDIRVEKPTIVARKVLSALNDGRLVVGTVDRIRNAPPSQAPMDSISGMVRTSAFGQPIGIAGWPARFALKAGVPIIPATVVQTKDTISLCLGASIEPCENLLETTQQWLSELERLIRAHPEEWTFALDKYWSKAVRAKDVG